MTTFVYIVLWPLKVFFFSIVTKQFIHWETGTPEETFAGISGGTLTGVSGETFKAIWGEKHGRFLGETLEAIPYEGL